MSLLGEAGAEVVAAAGVEVEVAVAAVAEARHDRAEGSLLPEVVPVQRVRNRDQALAETKRLPSARGELAHRRRKALPDPVARVRARADNVLVRPLLASDQQAPRPGNVRAAQRLGNVRPRQPDSVPAQAKALRLLPASAPAQVN
jgi:hypothetical protein